MERQSTPNILWLIFLDKQPPFFYIQPVKIFLNARFFQATKKIKAESPRKIELLEPMYG